MDRPDRPRYLIVVWVLLLVLGAFFLFALASDLAADARTGLPSDHVGTFKSLAGVTWGTAKHTPHGMAQYIICVEWDTELASLSQNTARVEAMVGSTRATWACVTGTACRFNPLMRPRA